MIVFNKKKSFKKIPRMYNQAYKKYINSTVYNIIYPVVNIFIKKKNELNAL